MDRIDRLSKRAVLLIALFLLAVLTSFAGQIITISDGVYENRLLLQYIPALAVGAAAVFILYYGGMLLGKRAGLRLDRIGRNAGLGALLRQSNYAVFQSSRKKSCGIVCPVGIPLSRRTGLSDAGSVCRLSDDGGCWCNACA